MVNLLGAPGFEGPASYQGLDKILSLAGAHVHLYGKTLTKPFRKMGHVTITDSNNSQLQEKARFVKEHLKIVS